MNTGFLFGFTYCITYTAVRTFAAAPYLYNALDIGLVLLSFGIGALESSCSPRCLHVGYKSTGSMSGSVIGGRWSDHVLATLKAANGGKTSSEVRHAFSDTEHLPCGLTEACVGPAEEHEAYDARSPTCARRLRMDGGEKGARRRRVYRTLPPGILVHVRYLIRPLPSLPS
jgi:hypothetical protein